MNKRGQGLSTNAIILIILGIVVLAVLVAGFTIGWSSFVSYVPSNNVNAVVTQCGIACSTDNTYDYCIESRTLKASELPNGEKEVTENCNFFATEEDYRNYGIATCSSITCS